MHIIFDDCEFQPDWKTDNILPFSFFEYTPIDLFVNIMVSHFFSRLFLICWLSGERSLPLGYLFFFSFLHICKVSSHDAAHM